MTQAELQVMNETFTQFKAANEQLIQEVKTLKTATPETQEKVTKINGRLDEIEQKINARMDEAQKFAEFKSALQARIDTLESMIARKGAFGGDVDQQKQDLKFAKGVFMKALRSGVDPKAIKHAGVLDEMELKALTVGDSTQAGYLAPPEYVNEILMDVVEWSNIRSVARVRTTSRQSIQIPKRLSTAVATWTAETGTRPETTNPSFGLESIPTHEMYAMVKVSKMEMEDSQFDLENFLREEFAEQFGLAEGAAFATGNAVGKPEGLLTNPSVASVNSGDAATITGDGMIALYYEVKEAYLNNATWLMNRSTLKTVRQLKDGNGVYLWTPGLKVEARPATLLDRPYLTCPDFPTVAAGTTPIIFGDIRRAFLIVDRLEMEMLVDIYTSKASGMVEISARRRVGGQVTIADAIKKMTIGA